MIKPDAFEVYGSEEAVIAFYKAIEDFLTGSDTVGGGYASRRDAAARQIMERSATEPAFQGKLSAEDGNRLVQNIEDRIGTASGDMICNIIEDAVELMGFRILQGKTCRLTPDDVSAIYSLSDENSLAQRLHDYLDGKTVRILLLSGDNGFLLQWIKTFVRHFFILDRTEVFPLKNLIHVSEEDFSYMESFLAG